MSQADARDNAASRTPLSSIQNVKDPIEKVGALAKWVSARLEEAQQLDGRIERRLEHLTRSEAGLVRLLGELQGTITRAQPLLGEMTRAQTEFREKLDAALAQVEPKLAEVKELAEGSPAAGGDVSTAAAVHAIKQASDTAQVALAERVQQFDGDLNAMLETMQSYLETSLDTARVNVDTLAENLAGRLHDAQTRAEAAIADAESRIRQVAGTGGNLAHDIEQAARDARDRVLAETAGQIEPMREQILSEISRHEEAVRAGVEEAETMFRRHMHAFDLNLKQTSTLLETQLQEALTDFQRQAQQVIECARTQAGELVASANIQTRAAAGPVLARIEEQRTATDAQITAALEAAEESLRLRVGQLRQSGEQMLDLVERQWAQRVQAVRPQALTAIDTAEKLLHTRLDRMLHNARTTIEASEDELHGRLDALSPRVLDRVRQVDAEVRQLMGQMETEAADLTQRLERRLSDRVSTLVSEARERLGNEGQRVEDTLARLDNAARMLQQARNMATPPTEVPPNPQGQAVEVAVHVEGETSDKLLPRELAA
ncbi:MAG: hypothetical protein ACFCVE_07095 [Phycisphaerae bacterium]